METKMKENKQTMESTNEMGDFFGKMYAFNNSLKLYHWHVSGKGSYAQHIALDQALEDLPDALDRIVETTYSLKGDIKVVIPETNVPTEIVDHCQKFFEYVDYQRELFKENFTAAILDDYQEAIQQLLYRLRRLE